MTRDDIIHMAEEAGAIHYWHLSNLERFARAAYAAGAAAEREACIDINAMHGGSVEVEAAIRARGEK